MVIVKKVLVLWGILFLFVGNKKQMDTIPFYQTLSFKLVTYSYFFLGVFFAVYFCFKKYKSEKLGSLIWKMFVIYVFPPSAYFFLKNKKQ